MIIDAGRTPVPVTRTNSSRSRAANLTGRFFCEDTTTVLVRQGTDLPHNVVGYSPHHDIWIQWALLQDVYRLICPVGHRHIRDGQAIHTPQGTVLSPRRRGEDQVLWPTNLPASAMVEALPDKTSKTYGETPLYGTVAWLGELAPTGLHVDLSETRIEEVVELCGRWPG